MTGDSEEEYQKKRAQNPSLPAYGTLEYFSNLKSADDEVLSNIVEYEMVPLLQEYWFDSPEMVAEWTAKLRNSIA